MSTPRACGTFEGMAQDAVLAFYVNDLRAFVDAAQHESAWPGCPEFGGPTGVVVFGVPVAEDPRVPVGHVRAGRSGRVLRLPAVSDLARYALARAG